VRTFFGQEERGGSSDADVRTFLRKKLRIFRNLWCFLRKFKEPVRTFCGQGRGVNFLRFCADAFYGRPLMYIFMIVFVTEAFILCFLNNCTLSLAFSLSILRSAYYNFIIKPFFIFKTQSNQDDNDKKEKD